MNNIFEPKQWGDKTFLAFIKEYWDFNVKPQIPNLDCVIILHILPDNSNIIEDITVYLKIVSSVLTPYLVIGEKPKETYNSVTLAADVNNWREVAKSENIRVLQYNDNLNTSTDKIAIARCIKTLISMGNRVSERLNEGALPSININESVKIGEYEELFKMPEISDISLVVGNKQTGEESKISVMNGMKKAINTRYLEDLRSFGPKKIKKFLKIIDKLPDAKGKNINQAPIWTLSNPTLKKDIKELEKQYPDANILFKKIENYFREKLA